MPGRGRVNRSPRITWLIEHRELWEKLPAKKSDLLADPEWPAKNREIVQKMKFDEIIAQSTYWKDVNLLTLIEHARRKMSEP